MCVVKTQLIGIAVIGIIAWIDDVSSRHLECGPNEHIGPGNETCSLWSKHFRKRECIDGYMKECIRNAVALTRPEEIDSETVISKMAEATTLTKGSEVPQNGTVPTETPTTPAVIKGTDVQHSETITTETPTTSAVTKGSEVPQNRTVKTETPTTAATVNSVNVSLLCSCMVLFLFNVYFSSSTFAYS